MSIDTSLLCNAPATVSVLGTGETYDIGSIGEGGAEMTRQPEYLHFQPQQATGIVKSLMTKEGWVVTFPVWRASLKNIDYFIHGGDGTTYTSGVAFGGEDTPETLAPVVIYGTAPGGAMGTRAVQFDQMIAIEPGGWVFDRMQPQAFQAKLMSHSDPADGTIGATTDS